VAREHPSLSGSQIVLVVLEVALIGVGAYCALVGGWTVTTGRLPGWMWLARMPVDRYVRLYGIAAVLLGIGVMIVMFSWSTGSPLIGGPAVGFALQVLAVGIWLYIGSKKGFIES
jgi:hypothetical protein